MAHKIMIIRHAEKPVPGRVGGVNERGEPDETALSVRGWQRAGALVRFFSEPDTRGIEVPASLFAGRFDAHGADGSQRPLQTIEPLARVLGMVVDDSITRRQEALLAKRCHDAHGPVLVSWHHEEIPALARAIAPKLDLPKEWPDDCFDRVWLLDHARGGWKFKQIPQRLLAGDAAEVA